MGTLAQLRQRATATRRTARVGDGRSRGTRRAAMQVGLSARDLHRHRCSRVQEQRDELSGARGEQRAPSRQRAREGEPLERPRAPLSPRHAVPCGLARRSSREREAARAGPGERARAAAGPRAARRGPKATATATAPLASKVSALAAAPRQPVSKSRATPRLFAQSSYNREAFRAWPITRGPE